MTAITWNAGRERVVTCNCCLIRKGEDDDGQGWYHSGRVDYCPKCAELMGKATIGTQEQMERLQTLVNRP